MKQQALDPVVAMLIREDPEIAPRAKIKAALRKLQAGIDALAGPDKTRAEKLAEEADRQLAARVFSYQHSLAHAKAELPHLTKRGAKTLRRKIARAEKHSRLQLGVLLARRTARAGIPRPVKTL